MVSITQLLFLARYACVLHPIKCDIIMGDKLLSKCPLYVAAF